MVSRTLSITVSGREWGERDLSSHDINYNGRPEPQAKSDIRGHVGGDNYSVTLERYGLLFVGVGVWGFTGRVGSVSLETGVSGVVVGR